MTAARPARRRAPRGRGDELRPQIVAAAKQVLAETDDSSAVSIRRVAEAVGVTPPSIYLHFADRDALIDAVVVDVFADLDVAMQSAAEGVEDPLERLLAFGLAYVRFAIGHPEHYRIATMERGGPDDAKAVDETLAAGAFTHFRDTVSSCMAEGVFAEDDPLHLTIALWTAAHGVASLVIAKPYLPWGDPIAFAEDVLRAAALGHAVNDLRGGRMTPADGRAFLDAQGRDGG